MIFGAAFAFGAEGALVAGGVDLAVMRLFTKLASAPIFRFTSVVISISASIFGGGFVWDFLYWILSVLLDLSGFLRKMGSGEFIVYLSGFLGCPTVLSVTRTPAPPGGGFGCEELSLSHI